MVSIFKPLALAAFAVAIFSASSVQSAEYPKAGASCATLATQGWLDVVSRFPGGFTTRNKEKTYVGYFCSYKNPGAALLPRTIMPPGRSTRFT